MKFRKSIQKAFASPKVKSIQMHPTRPVAVAALFSGQIQVWDTDRMAVLATIQVCSEPIRTCAILERMDWVLVGGDDGNVSVYELTKYRKIKSLHAHDDFIRKIERHPQMPAFVTASDDTTLKMWTYESDISLSMVYTGHSHFVMDVCFYPNDASKFVSCSLDSTIKVWSAKQAHCVKTFKGHTSGINTISFLGDAQYLVSGADDLTLRVWDFQTTQCIATLSGHTNNINRVYAFAGFPLFASCSEDGSIRLWNSKTFRQEDFVALQGGRVWDIKERSNKIMVGCDEELVFIDVQQASSLVVMSRNRVFFSVSDAIFGAKADNAGAAKELSSLGFYPSELAASPSGKVVGVVDENEFRIYSSLGFRSKFGGEGRDLHLVSDDEFVVRNREAAVFYRRSEVVRSITIPGLSRMFYLTQGLVGCNSCGQTRIYSTSGQFVFEIDGHSEHLFVVDDFLVACGSAMRIYRISHEVIDGFIEQEIDIPEEGIAEGFELLSAEHHAVSSYTVEGDVVYFVSGAKAYYTILGDAPHTHHFAAINGVLAGVLDGVVFYLQDKSIESRRIDTDFLEFQRDVLCGRRPVVPDSIRSKAIVFFESLGRHEDALDLCMDDNQRFEILLKLGRYEEAFESANSIIKYDKLGRHFLRSCSLGKASECFLRSRNWTSLLLTDMLSTGRHLQMIGTECEREGRMNCAFLAYLRSGQYEDCARLLENTPFHAVFVRTHLK